MSSHRLWSVVAATVTATVAVAWTTASTPARADTATVPTEASNIVAIDTTVPATTGPTADPALSGTVIQPSVWAAADRPRTITVGNHARRTVHLYAKGERARSQSPRTAGAVRFTHLTAGRTYMVVVGGAEVGALSAIDRPGPASGLTVRTTSTGDALRLTWRHRTSTATGGSRLWYDVTATSTMTAPIRTRVVGARTVVLDGLDRSVRYVFTVTPRNSAGVGRASVARMTRTLADLRPDHGATPTPPTTSAPTTSAPTPAPQPTPAPPPPAPQPAPAPAPTRTIYVCPEGSTELAARTCRVTREYTFTTKPYTFHLEPSGPAPILDEYSTAVRACPGGYNLEDYGWVLYCRRYGAVPMTAVKDDTPDGYSDDGTRWTKKDATPDGFTDDGTNWVKVVAKIPRQVPA